MASRKRDRLERWANPMLVRQMYQSLHSRKFLGALWLMLLAALMTYVVIFVATDPGSPAGGAMFMTFSVLFYLVALLVLPYMAFSSLREEVKTKTIELIHITPLNARRQIRGRLQAALSRLLLLYSIIGPFAVVAFLFGGVSLTAILLNLYTLFIASCVAVSIGLFFASLSSIKYLGPIARGAYLLLLVATLLAGLPYVFASSEIMREMGVQGLSGVATYIFILTMYGSLLAWFLCAASANILTFEANKSSGRTKFIMWLMVGSGFISFLVVRLLTSDYSDFLIPVEVFTSMALGGTAIFWLVGRRRLPAKVIEKFKNSILFRILYYPFSDGAGGTTLFLIGAVVTMGIALGAGVFLGARHEDEMGIFALFVLVYAPYFSSQAWLIGRIFPRKYRNASVRRLIVLGLVVVHIFIAVLWFTADIWSSSVAREHVSNPIAGLFPFVYVPIAVDGTSSFVPRLTGMSLAMLGGLVPHVVVSLRDLYRLCASVDIEEDYLSAQEEQ